MTIQRVLLVDDDNTTNFLHKLVLKKASADVELAVTSDGREALEYLNALDGSPPELILLDVNMPRMDGFEFLDGYREVPKERRAGVRIVMVTTSLLPKDRARAEDDELVTGFKSKPLTLGDARELLQVG